MFFVVRPMNKVVIVITETPSILPLTTAIVNYVTGVEKLSAMEQFSAGTKTAVT